MGGRARARGGWARGDHFIGTQHVLLAFVRLGDDTADALVTAGFDRDVSRRWLTEQRRGRQAGAASGHIPFTRNTKRAMERSVREADRAGRRSLGSADLLLGLLELGDTTARRLLDEQQVGIPALQRLLRDAAEAQGRSSAAETASWPPGAVVSGPHRVDYVVPVGLVNALHRYERHLDGCPWRAAQVDSPRL